jgi:PAS domain-containing protein
VCPTCGFGLLLEAPVDVAPAPNDPFIVVDQTLSVCAVSRAAERLLGISETEAVNRHVSAFLSGSDAEGGENPLIAALAITARGDGPTQNLVVRPANTFGVRYWARIGRCGPPKAALVVLADAS